MTSQIVSDTIDETYPIAGQDNDSQGFRDNFTIIKDGLATAASEVTDLQNSTAKLDEDNNFNGTLISNAQTNRLYGTVYNTDTIASSTVTVDYTNGEYQIITITRNCTLRFINWPTRPDETPVYGKMRVALVPDSATSYNVTFTTLNGVVRSQTPVTVVSTGSNPEVATVVDIWTASDTTNDIYINLLGNFNISFSLADLTDVNITNPQEDDFLKYIDGEWVNSSVLPGTVISSLHDDVDNVSIVNPGGIPAHGDLLVYDEDTAKWSNQQYLNQLGKLEDVSVATAEVGNVIRYTGIPNIPTSWRSETDPNLIQYNLFVSDNLSVDDEFFFGNPDDGGIPISSSGNILIFHIGNIYRFNLSDSSNSRAPLRFSTTVPSGTPTPYTSNVTVVGAPGDVGSYVDLLVTKDTPAVLYMYGDSAGTAGQPEDAGRDVAIIIKTKPYYSGSEQLLTGTASNIKSVSYFETSAPATSALAAGVEGQVKTFAMYSASGNMVVTVTNAGWKSSGTGTITLDTIGQACTLQYINGKWFCIGNNGAAFA